MERLHQEYLRCLLVAALGQVRREGGEGVRIRHLETIR